MKQRERLKVLNKSTHKYWGPREIFYWSWGAMFHCVFFSPQRNKTWRRTFFFNWNVPAESLRRCEVRHPNDLSISLLCPSSEMSRCQVWVLTSPLVRVVRLVSSRLTGAAQLFVPRLLWNVINKANPVSSSINQDYRFRFNGWRWIWISLKCSAA